MNGSTLDVRESRSVDILMESFPFVTQGELCAVKLEQRKPLSKFRILIDVSRQW
jgi:hypothetical protein